MTTIITLNYTLSEYYIQMNYFWNLELDIIVYLLGNVINVLTLNFRWCLWIFTVFGISIHKELQLFEY